jgi:hypothetical protein
MSDSRTDWKPCCRPQLRHEMPPCRSSRSETMRASGHCVNKQRSMRSARKLERLHKHHQSFDCCQVGNRGPTQPKEDYDARLTVQIVVLRSLDAGSLASTGVGDETKLKSQLRQPEAPQGQRLLRFQLRGAFETRMSQERRPTLRSMSAIRHGHPKLLWHMQLGHARTCRTSTDTTRMACLCSKSVTHLVT